jgi:hypothetical protein
VVRRCRAAARCLERHLVDAALVVVEGAVEAIELLGCERVGGAARFDVGDAAVVLLLIGLEGAEQIVEGVGEVAGAFGLGGGGGGHDVDDPSGAGMERR